MSFRDPAQLLQDIECALKPRIEAEGGTLDVVSTLEESLQMVATAPNKWRVILNWDGYGNHPNAREGMTSVQFVTILQVNTGLAIKPGSKVYRESSGGQPSFLSRLEQLSGWMRALKWPDGTNVDCAGLSLDDSGWVGDVPEKTIAHVLNWSVEMAHAPFSKNIIIKL